MFLATDSAVAEAPAEKPSEAAPAKRRTHLLSGFVAIMRRSWTILGVVCRALAPPEPWPLDRYRYVGRGQVVPRVPDHGHYTGGRLY